MAPAGVDRDIDYIIGLVHATTDRIASSNHFLDPVAANHRPVLPDEPPSP